jgi:gamma-glutamylaminecyclotransferase
MIRVFVYGTLKRGGSNHRHLAGQHFVAAARTAPIYRLYLLDGYPGLVEAPNQGVSVDGEIWAVDPACLARLDELEGTTENLYARRPVTLLPPHDALAVETYFYLQSIDGRWDLGTQFD